MYIIHFISFPMRCHTFLYTEWFQDICECLKFYIACGLKGQSSSSAVIGSWPNINKCQTMDQAMDNPKQCLLSYKNPTCSYFLFHFISFLYSHNVTHSHIIVYSRFDTLKRNENNFNSTMFLCRFTPAQLYKHLEDKGFQLVAVIDLTFTFRYYNGHKVYIFTHT